MKHTRSSECSTADVQPVELCGVVGEKCSETVIQMG